MQQPGERREAFDDDPAIDRFHELYAQTADSVLAYARHHIGRPEDAEDVASEVFMVAWRRGEALPHGEDARRWIYGVTRLVAANFERAQRRRTRLTGRLATMALRPSGHAETVDVGETVRSAMEHLTDLDRRLLFLTQWTGLSYAEAGRDTGLSEGAVTSRLHRARQALAATLADGDTERRPVKCGRPGRTCTTKGTASPTGRKPPCATPPVLLSGAAPGGHHA